MTTGVVAFNFTLWAQRFPEFATVDPSLAQLYFDESTLILDNSLASRVQQIENRAPLLNLLTAHLAKLYSGANGANPSQLVGRISQATEGTVTVAADMPNQPASAAWFQQTKYGAQFWAYTLRWRQATYVPGIIRPAPPPPLPQTAQGGWSTYWWNGGP